MLGFLSEFAGFANGILEYNIAGYLPFIVVWLMAISVFLCLKLRFINFAFIGRIPRILKSKNGGGKNEISPFQAILSSIGSTLGLGNIAGTAVAISIGGVGAIVWIGIFGTMGMIVKSCEVHLGHKYRVKDADGGIIGGPAFYLRDGFKRLGMPGFGLVLAASFSVFTLFAIFGMAGFQFNQMVITVGNLARNTDKLSLQVISVISGLVVGFTIIGGVQRIAKVADKVVPFMVAFYFGACFVVIIKNITQFIPSMKLIFAEAFNFKAGLGGFLTVMITGARRALFAAEAGQGTSPIINANSSAKYSQEQAMVALLDPFVSAIVVCFTTGLMLVMSGVYNIENLSGINMTTRAFETVSPMFSWVLGICVILFAFTTILTDIYYGEVSVKYFTSKRILRHAYLIIFMIFLVFSGFSDINLIVAIADIFVLLMSIPNIIGLYALSSELKRDFYAYKLLDK
jgi:AGCS family alanine or glycine:cation symporter